MFYTFDNDRNNNDDQYIKRRGTSLVRPDFHRHSSFNNNTGKQLANRNSVLDPPARLESSQTGGTKLINFFKTGFHLSKFKSKSKANLQEKRQNLYNDSQSSKSEENLVHFEYDSYLAPIRAVNLLLNCCKPTLYVTSFNSNKEKICKPVVVLDRDCTIQPVHPSIAGGQSHCFQIIKRMKSEITTKPLYSINVNRDGSLSSQIPKSCSYNSSFRDLKPATKTCESVNIIRCLSATDRNEWIMKIKKHINPNIERSVRHEDILKIWIQEAKNLLPKKRYFCEIRLDQILFGRTTIKIMNDMIFWGEEFEFTGLHAVGVISVSIYRVVDAKRNQGKSELVALINLPCSDLLENSFTEKWYSPSSDLGASNENLRYSKALNPPTSITDDLLKCVIDYSPMIRIKARYRPLEIIPTNYYQPLVDYIVEDNVSLAMSLENHLKVKSKEEFMTTVLPILQHKGKHVKFLSDIVLMEVYKADDNLILRGNTMASKAMECYLKNIGEKYLSSVLTDMIFQVTTKEMDCEVDPLRITNFKDHLLIANNQKKLLVLVEGVWKKISCSAALLPNDLKSVFAMIRDKLSQHGQITSNLSLMIDQVISSCLFLRFICPAIMSPFLFGLSKEYSDKLCINRTFTLIAKCIQSLANFSESYHAKEAYMGFLQDFLTRNTPRMHTFLHEISTTRTQSDASLQVRGSSNQDMSVDLGYQLAELSYQLTFHFREIPITDCSPSLERLRTVLEKVSKSYPRYDMDEQYRSSRFCPPKHASAPKERVAVKSMMFSSFVKSYLDEDFSYIPDESPRSSYRQGDLKLNGSEYYIDLENSESKHYDEPSFTQDSSPRDLPLTKFLNEKEINKRWTNVLNDSYTHSTALDNFPVDVNPSTVNSSGYASLNLPSYIPHNHAFPSKPVQQRRSDSCYQTHNDIITGIPHHNIPQKFTTGRLANIYRRIKRNSNVYGFIDGKLSGKMSPPNLNDSCDTFGSLDNLPGSDNSSLKSCKSLSSIYQKKTSNNKKTQMSFNINSSNSRKNISPKTASRDCSKSQSLSASMVFDSDLDSFVSNEISRLLLFLEYYSVDTPSPYCGNEVEQYKSRTLDENLLKQVLVNQAHLGKSDIIKYLEACFRLLMCINNSGQTSTEFIIKSVMEINHVIQSHVLSDYQITRISAHEVDQHVATLRSVFTNHEPCSLSTESLPSPPSRYSTQSLKTSLICDNSRETSSNLNLSKSLTIHDIFEHY